MNESFSATHLRKLRSNEMKHPDEPLKSRSSALTLTSLKPFIHSLVHSLISVCSFLPSFHKQTSSEPLLHAPLCQARPGTHSPQHTIGAVAAIHTGDLAVHAGCPGLAGGGAAGDALIVDKALLLTVHSSGGRERVICHFLTASSPQTLGRGGGGAGGL